MRQLLASTLLWAVLATVPAFAVPTVVNFDDLPGSGTVADGYGGIIWNGVWSYYDDSQPPYNPSSPFTRIYAGGASSFNWLTPVVFTGSFLNGQTRPGGNLFHFDLYLGGVLQASSATVESFTAGAGQFLASNYAGLVDRVDAVGSNGFYVLDDVTYEAAVAAPELNANSMGASVVFMAGLLLVLRSRRRRPVVT